MEKIPELQKAVPEQLFSNEEMLGALETRSDQELSGFEQSDTAFIETRKKLLNIEGNNPAAEAGVKEIREKYGKERRSLRTAFFARLKKMGTLLAGATLTISTIADLTQQEYPDHLEKKKKESVEWNAKTRKEIHELAATYRELVHTRDSSYAQAVPDSLLEERFLNFAATYGPDISIAHPGHEMNTSEEIGQWVFHNIFAQENSRAHYFSGILWYEKDTAKSKTGKVTEFKDFCAEFAHHLNGDIGWRRSMAYVHDMVNNNLQQHELYADVYSNEYQAHDVTENAIERYLFPDSTAQVYEFNEIYNTMQDYYRAFASMGERIDESFLVEWLTFRIIFNHPTQFVIKNKDEILSKLYAAFDRIKQLPDKNARYVGMVDAANEMMEKMYKE